MYLLPAAASPLPVRAPRSRLAQGLGPGDVGCEAAGAGLVADAPVPGLVADALEPGLCGDEEQAVASAATDRSTAKAPARPTARIDRIMGVSPYAGASDRDEPLILPYGQLSADASAASLAPHILARSSSPGSRAFSLVTMKLSGSATSR